MRLWLTLLSEVPCLTVSSRCLAVCVCSRPVFRVLKDKAYYYVQKGRACLVIHTLDAVRWNRVVCRTKPLAYTWGCVVTRPAQLQRRVLGYKRKPLKLHLRWIAVLKKASAACFGGIFWHGQKKYRRPLNQDNPWHCFVIYKISKSAAKPVASKVNEPVSVSLWSEV